WGHQLSRKRLKRWRCITSIISIQSWKCSPPGTQRPHPWPRASSTACDLCLGTSLSRWRNFSNPQTLKQQLKASCCDTVQTYAERSRGDLGRACHFRCRCDRNDFSAVAVARNFGRHFTPAFQEKSAARPDYRMRTNPDTLVVRLGNSSDAVRLAL